MSHYLIQGCPEALVSTLPAVGVNDAPPHGTAAPTIERRAAGEGRAAGERRRPGRMENVSPELIRLMRKPDRAARLRVALYDAPGFILPQQERISSLGGCTVQRMALALVGCSVGCTAAFEAMLYLWG